MNPFPLQLACEAGKFLSEGACIDCPEGTYTPYAGEATVCITCYAGYGTASNSSTECQPCINEHANGFGCSQTALPEAIDTYTWTAIFAVFFLVVIVVAVVSLKHRATKRKQKDGEESQLVGGAEDSSEAASPTQLSQRGFPLPRRQDRAEDEITLFAVGTMEDDEDGEDEQESRKQQPPAYDLSSSTPGGNLEEGDLP